MTGLTRRILIASVLLYPEPECEHIADDLIVVRYHDQAFASLALHRTYEISELLAIDPTDSPHAPHAQELEFRYLITVLDPLGSVEQAVIVGDDLQFSQLILSCASVIEDV